MCPFPNDPSSHQKGSDPSLDEDSSPRDERPSKSARKRAAHEAQDLGEALIGLKDADLNALDLPEILADAIREAKRIPSRGGGARQRQYIGKLMREMDLEPIRAALEARGRQSAVESEKFKRLEAWRERLIVDGLPALDELERWRPGLDRDSWTRLMDSARAERARSPVMGVAGRELFRALRALFDHQPVG
ncbi:MAG TPA: ribosome biogenesis factor YjgA [Steroidobacteraceae bacterium]|jgi:ribosome-associated protein